MTYFQLPSMYSHEPLPTLSCTHQQPIFSLATEAHESGSPHPLTARPTLSEPAHQALKKLEETHADARTELAKRGDAEAGVTPAKVRTAPEGFS